MRLASLPALLLSLALLPLTGRAAAPAPYSLPWQLRPAGPVNVVRADSSLALASSEAGGALTSATLLLGSWKVTPQLAPMVRLGVVGHSPTGTPGGLALVNPVVGGTYGLQLNESLRLAFFLGVAVPVGMGGGNSPDAQAALAARSGILARSAMDSAMFAVNDLTVFPGVDLAWVAHGLTVQLEATVLQLTRVRGEAVQPDASRTNFTSGLHVGYFVLPALSLAGEVRYQRWLSTPAAVAAAPAQRDNLTLAAGPRLHLKLSETMTVRPGFSYAFALDAPMSPQRYSIFQLDVPVNF